MTPTPTLDAGKPPTLAQLLDKARAVCKARDEHAARLARRPPTLHPRPGDERIEQELDASAADVLDQIVRHLDADTASGENVTHTTNQED